MNRAKFAFSLSLLREREFKAIKTLARIRNEFAHKWDEISFDNKIIEKLVNSFPVEYFAGIEGSNRVKFNCVASDTVQQLLARSGYAEGICHRLPREYKDMFDLPIEERRRLLEARRKK